MNVTSTKGTISTKNPKTAEELAKKGINVNLTETEIDEAKLINGIDEYQGGVMYAIKDPAQAQEVSDDIKQWAEKKGFTIIKRTISKSGKNGYFYFRLGEDPEKDAQRIQGYFAQRLELAAFKFKVRGEANPARELPPAAPRRSTRKI
jgi:fructose-specific phosphotransferase system component IIB